MATGSEAFWGAAVKSTGFMPDHADKAVRLAASGFRPFDILESVDCETPVCSLTVPFCPYDDRLGGSADPLTSGTCLSGWASHDVA